MTRTTRLTYVGIVLAGLLVAALLVFFPQNSAHATDTNQPEHWQNQPGEICVKVDDTGKEEGGYTVPAEPDGRDWSTLIIKKGSGNIGTENQVFENPVAGNTYTWVGFDDKQSGGYSHVILCSIPEPVDEPETVTPNAPTFTDTCGPDNEVLTTPNQTGVVFNTVENPNGTFTVTASPANDTYVFPENAQTVWVFVANDAVCPTETPTVPTETPTVTETPVVPTPTVTVTPPIVTETPVVPTETETVTETPEPTKTPVSTPEKDEPVVTTVKDCVGDSLVTSIYKDGVKVSTSSVPNKDCAEEVIRTTGEPTQEEGL